MNDSDLLNAFNDCIDRLNAGQSIDECVRRYPRFASQLQLMLETGQIVRRAQVGTAEISAAQDRVRFALQQHLRRVSGRSPRPRSNRLIAAVAVVLLLFVAFLTVFAQDALPGDPLYALKRASENVRLALSSDPTLRTDLEQTRRDEVTRLAALARPADVTFEGVVERVTGEVWQVSGMPVIVAASVPGAQGVHVGDRVKIQARTTAQGQILATSVEREDRRDDSGTATPTPFATPTLDNTATPTATQTPFPSATASATPTLTPTVTRTSSPTATASATSTLTPTATFTPSASTTASVTPTLTPTVTRTSSPTATASATSTLTPTATFTPSPTATARPSATATVRRPRPSPTAPPQPPPPTQDIGGNNNDNQGDSGGSSGNDNGNDGSNDNDDHHDDDDDDSNDNHGGGQD